MNSLMSQKLCKPDVIRLYHVFHRLVFPDIFLWLIAITYYNQGMLCKLLIAYIINNILFHTLKGSTLRGFIQLLNMVPPMIYSKYATVSRSV